MASVESVPAYLHPGVQVSQPPHLEGDPSLATEILPGPPPLSSIQQAGLPRKDHKKTAIAYSYLPASDPGTTYASHIASIIPAAATDMDGPRRKRARLDKGAERNRAQRASARSLAVGGPLSDPITAPEASASSSQLPPEYDPLSLPLDSDDAMASRATTAHPEDMPSESAPSAKRGRGRSVKDNGKGKERESTVKVKEEPGMVSLGGESNEDHCSACRSFGSLVYCDGCPRAFHLWCLDPPMETADLPEGERWFCPACTLEQRPPPKPPASLKFMGPLIHELSTKIPCEYQLPQDIRTFFKDVGSSARGTYVDTSEIKQARLNRHGQLEDRDPYRLKDRNGDAVLCFRCGTSALPPGLAADSPLVKRARRASSGNGSNYETGRAIISCDYCHLHWHLDCLDPPLVFMPPWNKKWMCPNHAERILQPKHRIPRANATPIEITKPHQWNNGIIEVVNTDTAPPPAIVPDKLNVDEVLINGRRYRVPERIITLDFWDKVSKTRGITTEARELDQSSSLSSPLTSLTSLDDDESVPPMSMEPSLYTLDDVRFAQLLCGLRLQNPSTASEAGRGSSVSSVHHDAPHTHGTSQANQSQGEASVTREAPGQSNKTPPGEAAQSSPAMSSARPRRAAASRPPAPAPAPPVKARPTRRSGRSTDDVPMDVDLPELVISSGKRPDARRKAARPPESPEDAPKPSEPTANGVAVAPKAEPAPEAISNPSTSGLVRAKRNRQAHQRQAEPAVTETAPPDANPAEQSKHISIRTPKATSTARAGKKKANGASEGAGPTPRAQNKPTTPPTVNGQTPSAAGAALKPEATPTLKIRLPRLSMLHSPSVVAQPSADTTSKASPTKAGAIASESSRPRRSLRRQSSIPASLNSATTSDASSNARVNENGHSTSPIESF
ncbi:hypothetical protein PYCCODRAFT_1435055 [Trametes coccinea BRFM310]|uniref:PHD-type domain-containing protein n=1 Tax=Trametes coccinea (strain BRFM310) TaxID=1353009 RepID=A0A1Y2IQ63_TRAC3|nr:hypothetical protein PYCCODRAFT_1435055 [Trametes coccinea BRFM310]